MLLFMEQASKNKRFNFRLSFIFYYHLQENFLIPIYENPSGNIWYLTAHLLFQTTGESQQFSLSV
jgi:hypothetical protein